MANWYYYNTSGEKVGPITPTALKALAMQGLITPETVIENGNGRSSVAGKVNGLTFPEMEEVLEVQLGEVDFGSPDEEEVYGLALPESKIPPPIESNPFTLAIPLDSNPFTGTMPTVASPFTAVPPSVPQPVSPSERVKENPALLLAIVGGVLLLLMIIASISQTGSSHSKDPKQAIIDVNKKSDYWHTPLFDVPFSGNQLSPSELRNAKKIWKRITNVDISNCPSEYQVLYRRKMAILGEAIQLREQGIAVKNSISEEYLEVNELFGPINQRYGITKEDFK